MSNFGGSLESACLLHWFTLCYELSSDYVLFNQKVSELQHVLDKLNEDVEHVVVMQSLVKNTYFRPGCVPVE